MVGDNDNGENGNVSNGAVSEINSNSADSSRVYHICLLTSMVTTFVGVSGLASWEATGSALMLGLGMINLVEMGRSVAMLWRFSSPRGETMADIMGRDERTSLIVTASMLVTGIAVFIVSLVDFTIGQEPVNVPYMLSIAVPSTLFFAFLGKFKISYAPRLKSNALMVDGLSSWIFA